MTTLDAARDVESIRKALGVSEINPYGFSYGTYVGQVYATLYPKQPPRQSGDGPDASCDALPQPVPAGASARALRGGGPLVPATRYALLR